MPHLDTHCCVCVEMGRVICVLVCFPVLKVRAEIELGNLAKCYLWELLKRDCWDSMKVKGKAIKVG